MCLVCGHYLQCFSCAVISFSFERSSYTVAEGDGSLPDMVYVLKLNNNDTELNYTINVERVAGTASLGGSSSLSGEVHLTFILPPFSSVTSLLLQVRITTSLLCPWTSLWMSSGSLCL